MPGLGWAPRGGRHEHAAIRLLDTAAIRKLPVRGRHIAFVPHTHLLLISGSYDHAAVQKLTQLAMNEFASPQGKPLAPGPLILEEDGRWRPWHPGPEHPSHWSVKRLHTLGSEQLYRLQKEMLDELQADKTDRPFVASYRALEDNGRLYSYCVFTVTSLLPRTEYVMLRPIANEAEVTANPKAEPQFGPPLFLTWESFAAFQGANLKAEGMFPERYYIDQYPDADEWKKLLPEQQKVVAGVHEHRAQRQASGWSCSRSLAAASAASFSACEVRQPPACQSDHRVRDRTRGPSVAPAYDRARDWNLFLVVGQSCRQLRTTGGSSAASGQPAGIRILHSDLRRLRRVAFHGRNIVPPCALKERQKANRQRRLQQKPARNLLELVSSERNGENVFF